MRVWSSIDVWRSVTVVLVVSVSCSSPRRTSMTASPSALARICDWRLSQSLKGVPLKLRISSPARSPASFAGVGGSSAAQARPCSSTGTTHAGTAATTGSTTSSRGLP